MIIANKKNSAFELAFPMVDSTTPASFKTGLSPVDTAYYKDGAGAWTDLAITDTAAEIGTTGIYKISLTAAEMNHDWVNIKFTASGAADTLITFKMFTDPITIWHVAKTGSDNNNGHSYEYAKLTIGAAVTASASGDKIIIWPGTYNELIDGSAKSGIKLIGMGWNTLVESSSQNSAVLKVGDNWIVENLKISNTYSPTSGNEAKALYASQKTNLFVRNCYLKSAGRPVALEECNAWILDSLIEGSECGLALLGGYGSVSNPQVFIKNSYIKLSGWITCAAWGIFASNIKLHLIDSSIFVTSSSTTSSDENVGISCESSWLETGINIKNTRIYVKHENTNHTHRYGIRLSVDTDCVGDITIEGSSIVVEHGVVSTDDYDLIVTGAGNGTILIGNSHYDSNRLSGNIKICRIDVGKWLGTEVTLSAGAPDVNIQSSDNIDFGALQKTSLNAATPASVVGNVGGNVVGSIGSLAGQAQEEVGEVTDAIINANTTIGTIKTDIETTGVVVKDLTTAAKALIQTEAEDAVVAKNLDHFTARTSNAQAGGANTITLDASSSPTDNYYNGRTILITAGTGAGQTRRIISYNGTTKVATVDSNWSSQPVNGSEFLILNLYDAEVTAIKAKTDLIGASVALETGGNAAAIKTVTDKLETAVELDGAVYRFTANALEMAPSGGASVGAIADAVWDETAAEHVAAGTTGKKLNDISGGAPINVQHDSTHIVRN